MQGEETERREAWWRHGGWETSFAGPGGNSANPEARGYFCGDHGASAPPPSVDPPPTKGYQEVASAILSLHPKPLIRVKKGSAAWVFFFEKVSKLSQGSVEVLKYYGKLVISVKTLKMGIL